ncbi:MAG: ATP-binding protein [Candidatus Rokuibacteriota bacterium]
MSRRGAPERPAGEPLWASILGQEPALALLRRALDLGRLPHAYAFVGPTGVGRRRAALGLAQACLCPTGGCGACSACRRVAAGHHPDCQVLLPTPPRDNPRGVPALRIEQVRELEHWAALAPLEGSRKVFILDEADRMTLPTAQALLKTLEEPPPRTLLVLVISNVRALPPTVLSRCQLVRFRPLDLEVATELLGKRGADPEAARVLARLCRGQVGVLEGSDLAGVRERRAEALSLLEVARPQLVTRLDEAAPDRAEVAAYLETYWLWYRDALCLAAGGASTLLVNVDRQDDLTALARRTPIEILAAAVSAIKEAWLGLEGNLNPRLALEQALLSLNGRPASGG